MARVQINNGQGYALVDPPKKVQITNAQGYMLQNPPNPISVREVRGYVMAKRPNQLSLRQFVGYAMVRPLPPLQQGVTGERAVLNMIAALAKTSRPYSDFTVVTPEVLANDALFNTRVKATATASSGLFGSKYFRYNRVTLGRMGVPSGKFDFGTATTIYELIPKLNASSGMTLTTNDFVDGPIASGATTVTLTASNTSFWFIPGNTLVLTKA